MVERWADIVSCRWRALFSGRNGRQWLCRTLPLGLLLALLPLAGPAQTLPSRSFGLSEGLPETSVSDLAQDGQGRLWVVSEVGAAWYDGHGFHSLTTRSGLPNTRVTTLAADPGPGANLWLGLRDGSICYYSSATGRARRITPRRVQERFAQVLSLLPQGSGAHRRLWVGTAGGALYCLRWPDAPMPGDSLAMPLVQPVRASASPDDKPKAINALAPAPAGGLWVGTDEGLRLLDAATGQPRPLPVALPDALRTGPVLGLNAAADGRLWCTTPAAGLFVLDPAPAGGQVRHYTTAQGLCSDRVLRAVAEPGPTGRVWALTGNGLCYLNNATAAIARCLPGTGLVSHSYRRGDLLLDREGSLWSTSANGLTQYLPDARFALFDAADGLPGTKVYALAPAANEPGSYWVGTNDGLALLHPGAGGGLRCRALPRRAPDTHNVIRAVLPRANGDVWVGTTQGGSAVWEAGNKRWRLLSLEIPALAETTVASMVEDARGRIWLATETHGLVVYDPATGRQAQYVGPALAGARRVMKILRSRTGALWLGTESAGLVQAEEVAPAGGGAPGWRFWAVAPRPAGAEPLSVFSISEDRRGKLWLSSFGEGIFTYDPAHAARGLRPVPLREEPGAHLDNPYFVQCDAMGGVWLGTTRGLLRYQPGTGRQEFFGREEGFIGQETGINAVLAEPDGTLWAGTVAGLMRYTPAGARPNRVAPFPRLTGLRLFMRDTALLPGASLPHSLNHLTFDYSANSLANPGRVRYQYRLVGFDNGWTAPLAARSAAYTNLPPGHYRFELRAANEAGVWSAAPAAFAFRIRPPWWRTWWAYGLYGLGFVLTMGGVRAYTRRRERERADRQLERQALEHLQEMDRVKNDFFTNISHEFRTPLTLILGPAETLAADAANPATQRAGGLVVRNARKMLALVNQVLDLSKLEAGALRLQPTAGDAAAAVCQLVASFAALAESRRIALRCEIPAGPVPLVFDAGKLDEILTNLLANALRFTPSGGEVVVEVAERPATAGEPAGRVAVAVRDSGPGIAAAEIPFLFERFYQAQTPVGRRRIGTGIGLALVRELALLHGGAAHVASELGVGTTFTVELPRGLRAIAAEAGAGPTPLDAVDAAPSHPAAAEEAEAAVPLAHADAEVVLIIEDHEEVRRFVRDVLAPEGYRLLLAADGQTGLALARAEVPDLVVSDVMMPGLNGYEVCAALKTATATSHIPVVLLTAKSDPGARLEGLETGADSFVAKPFSPRELRAQVRNLLALRHRVQARFAAGFGPAAPPEPEPVRPVAPAPDPLAAHAAAVAGLPTLDQDFLRRVNEAVLHHLADETYGVEQLGTDIGLSRTQAHRKLKALTGQSPGEYIRGQRLHRALALLRGQVSTVAEVSYQVGFGSPASFSTAFSRQFGYPPSAAARHAQARDEAEAAPAIAAK